MPYAAQPAAPRPARGAAPATVTVVLPAHNEAPTLAAVIERCRSATPGLCQVLVVDDGSTDDTGRVATLAGAEVVRLCPNRGKGVAIRAGLERARGEIVIFLDADGQDHPEEIPDLLAALDEDVGLVIGSRFIGRFDPGAISRVNHAGSLALRTVLNRLWGIDITDPFAGFRAFRRDALAGCVLSANRYDIEIDMLLALVSRGVGVVEVPVRRSPRAHGSSDLGSVRDGSLMLAQMLRWKLASVVPRGARQ